MLPRTTTGRVRHFLRFQNGLVARMRSGRRGDLVRRRHDACRRRLVSVALFGDCSGKELDTIDQRGTVLALDVGRTVWREEVTTPQFVVVLDGRIELSRAGEPVAALERGGWWGHAALLARRLSESHSAITSTPTLVLASSGREFASILEAIPRIVERLVDLNELVLPDIAAAGRLARARSQE